jgi:hypothetical protein
MTSARPAEPDRSVLLDIYRRANLIFRADEKFRAMIGSGQLQIIYYSPRGQEILTASLMAALNTDDYLVTTYRGVHDQLAKGIPTKELWAEFAGKKTGTCKGKGGPMHITHRGVFRRCRQQYRRLPRSAEYGADLETAGDFRLPKQSLRRAYAAGDVDRRRRTDRPCARLRDSGRPGERQ